MLKTMLSLLVCFFCASFLWAQKPRLVVPIGHTGAISSVAFSPDGKTVLTGSDDKTAKLWDLSGRELQSFSGHTTPVSSVAFSPDGKTVLTGSWDKTAKLWDLSGHELQSFSGHANSVSSVAISPDGKTILTGSWDKTAILWDLSGRELQSFTGHASFVESVAFSPDGKAVLTGSLDKTAKLWDLSGHELYSFTGHGEGVSSVAFSPDGKTVLTGSWDKTAKLWDLSGNELYSFTGHAAGVSSVAFSPDGKTVLTGCNDKTARLWDLLGRELQSYIGHISDVRSVAFSPDGKIVLASSLDKTARLWDLSGQKLQSFGGHTNAIISVAFSPDRTRVLTGSLDNGAKCWDLAGRGLQTFIGHTDAVLAVAFSPDGRMSLTGSKDNTAKLWDQSGRELESFIGHTGRVNSVAFSPDGKTVLTGSWDKTVKLWDLSGQKLQSFTVSSYALTSINSMAFSPDGTKILTGSGLYNLGIAAKLWDLSGRELQSFDGHTSEVTSVTFSADGKTVVTGSDDKTARLWNLSGKELKSFKGHVSRVTSVAFSPDCPDDPEGKNTVLTGSDDCTAKLWDLSGRVLQTFSGHASYVRSVAFYPDRKKILTGSDDNTCKIWDANTGNLLSTLISIDSNDWVVTAPSGLFDASPGAMNLMHYMVGLDVIDLEQLKDRYYEPGLLAKVMGFAPGGLRPVEELNNVPLYPEVLEASIQNDVLKIRLKPRNGGIGKVAILLGKREIITDANPGRKTNFKIDLKPYADFFSPDQPNNLNLRFYNQDGWLKSQPYPLDYLPSSIKERGPGEKASVAKLMDAKLEEINLYALVVGTSNFRGSQLNLKYPDIDAASFADALRQAGNALFKERTEVRLLNTETDPWPRKEVIRQALRDIAAKADANDILLIYFSGHGITYPPNSEKGQFYYLTTDIAGDKLDDPSILNSQAIAQDSLQEWIRQIKARKRILILDACNSGSVVESLEPGAKELNSDQRRALERINDRSGMFVLAGSAADKSSFEASSYGHGLLTYSLLNGMLAVAAKKNNMVEVGDLFSFVRDDVPILAKNISKVQTPELIAAESYPIGIIDEHVHLKMPTERPVFVRANFIYSKRAKDLLDLSPLFNAELERVSAGKNAPLVFWDVASYSGKYYYLGGEYQAEGENISGTAYLYQENTELHTFPFAGTKANLGKMVKDLVFEVQAYLGK